MGKDRARQLSLQWSSKAPETVLRHAVETFGAGDVAFATSLGAEDQVITDLLHKEGLLVPVFTLDTGRLPEETYDVLDATRRRYGLHVDVLFPQTQAVETMLSHYGANLFYESIEKRKECCRIRKVEPLSRKLSTVKAWICGLRREQSVTRQGLDLVEWDESFGLFKINPLADASEAWVWEYIRSNDVPYNRLHDRGYPSIGCAPCTRSVQPGEDIRSGRWWWESPEHKECGLHRRPV
jgi:phosphoadenosine phosphosulfate reductase